MIWERDVIVRLLREQGFNDRAFLAQTQLPVRVDAEAHANLLHEYCDVTEAWLVSQASADEPQGQDDTGVV